MVSSHTASFLFPVLALCGILLGLAVGAAARLFGCRALPKTRLVLAALFFAALVPGLYFWEVLRQPPLISSGGADSDLARFAVHLFVLAVMALVSIIDFEQYVIPDLVMVPATVLAVLLMALFPGAAMPDYDIDPSGAWIVPRVLTAFPYLQGVRARFLLSAGGILFWIFALLDRRCYLRLGLKRSLTLFFRRLRQSRLTCLLLGIGAAALLALWGLYRLPAFEACEAQRTALLSALAGLTGSMLLIWGVRLIGGAVLGREAMGFGDVILMGFLGAVFGWQGGLVIFFLAPLAGVVFGLGRLICRSPREIPYGPFLCLAALAVIFLWEPILLRIHDFLIGPLVAAILLAMGVLMALLLWVIQILKRCLR